MGRSFQELVYNSLGREFFTYLVFAVITTGLITLLYVFMIKIRLRNLSQYFYVILCAGLYVFFTDQLGGNPEEAVHIIEYGVLSFFVFRALSFKIKDWTIYITAVFLVLLLGTTDEFLQWIMPGRYWDYRDIGINFMGSTIFLFAIWKGIRPVFISSAVTIYSVRVLVAIVTLNLMFLGLCLSNTPNNVKRYTSSVDYLSWLQQEEPMTEFGYKNRDLQIGYFYSRFRSEELIQIDSENGKAYGELLYDDNHSGLTGDDMTAKYGPDTNPFLYEFLLHHFRTAFYIKEFLASSNLSDKSDFAKIALTEIFITKKYFAVTFENSGLRWLSFDNDIMKKAAMGNDYVYISRAGRLITGFDLNTSRTVILVIIFIVWTGGEIWKRKLNGD